MLPDCPTVALPASTASVALAASKMTARWLRLLLCQLCMALACTLLWGMPGLVLAQTGVLPVPALTARVIDQTGTLSATDKAALEAKLADYEKTKGSQIVVLMVPTTQPEDIAAYAHRVASDWKIGRRDVGDGVLVIVAKDDRRMRIEVARALEGALPDLAAARIMDGAMQPRFRANDYAGGLTAAVEQITQVLDGEPLPPVQPTSRSTRNIDWSSMLMFFLGMLIVGSSVLKALLGRVRGSLVTGASLVQLCFSCQAVKSWLHWPAWRPFLFLCWHQK